MAYSAVTHPRPELRSQLGTPFSIVALHKTRVYPAEIRTDPSAVRTKPGVSVKGRSSLIPRPSLRKKAGVLLPAFKVEVGVVKGELGIERLYEMKRRLSPSGRQSQIRNL
jgi:hypothetical protein